MGGYDNSVFKLATMAPIAVSTSNIPAQYKGIKFVRITDWTGVYKFILHQYEEQQERNAEESQAECISISPN